MTTSQYPDQRLSEIIYASALSTAPIFRAEIVNDWASSLARAASVFFAFNDEVEQTESNI